MATAIRFTDEATGRDYTGALEVLDSTGDTRLIWDRDNPDEVENARAMFQKLTKDRKYSAFKAKRDGSQGERMDTFDPAAERMLLIPQYQGG